MAECITICELRIVGDAVPSYSRHRLSHRNQNNMPSFARAAASILFSASLALIVPTASTVKAETYPSKPVRIIVPYGAGGIADVTMRLVADDLGKRFGQQFFIENRPGAGGVVGMQAAKDAPADGYTLVMLGGGLTIAKALFKSLPYDIETDFIPISTTASYGLVITAKAGSTYKTANNVIADAKTHPGARSEEHTSELQSHVNLV